MALRRAGLLQLAKGVRLELLHVLPEPKARAHPGVPRLLRRKLTDELDGLDGLLVRRGIHDAALVSTVAYGAPYREILQRARATRAELIVLGRHGTSGVRTTLLGSTAERVVRGKAAPVLVVTANAEVPYVRPLVALDPHDAAAPSLLSTALRLVGTGPSGLDVVAAYQVALEGWLRAGDVRASAIAQMRKRAAREAHDALARHAARVADRLKIREHIRAGDARTVILRTIDRRRPDVVVLGSHVRRGLARFLLGSVAVEVLRSAQVDVAIVPPLPRPDMQSDDEAAFTLPPSEAVGS